MRRYGRVRQLVVHIGPRKTGSTSIQRMLATCAAGLRAHGIHVAHTGSVPTNRGKHLPLAREAAQGGTAQWARLAEEVRVTDGARIVLSSEDFSNSGCRAPAAARIAALAARESLDVKIVAYVRPQWQILEAEYSQRVCGGRVSAPFPRFVAEQLLARENTILDYNLVFAPYREVFGDRVHVFPLESAAPPEGLLAHFLARIGAPIHLLDGKPARRANARRGAREIEVLRVLGNRMPKSAPAYRSTVPGLRAAIGDDAPFAGFAVDEIRAIEMRFAESNRRFAVTYGIDPAAALFRHADHGPAPRPNIAHWERFDAADRRRVRDHVRRELGFDLEGGAWHRALYVLQTRRVTLARRLRRGWRGNDKSDVRRP